MRKKEILYGGMFAHQEHSFKIKYQLPEKKKYKLPVLKYMYKLMRWTCGDQRLYGLIIMLPRNIYHMNWKQLIHNNIHLKAVGHPKEIAETNCSSDQSTSGVDSNVDHEQAQSHRAYNILIFVLFGGLYSSFYIYVSLSQQLCLYRLAAGKNVAPYI